MPCDVLWGKCTNPSLAICAALGHASATRGVPSRQGIEKTHNGRAALAPNVKLPLFLSAGSDMHGGFLHNSQPPELRSWTHLKPRHHGFCSVQRIRDNHV